MERQYIILERKPGVQVVQVRRDGEWHTSKLATWMDMGIGSLGCGLADEAGCVSEVDEDSGDLVASDDDILWALRQPAAVIAMIAALCDAMFIPWPEQVEAAMEVVKPINPWVDRQRLALRTR